MGFEAVRFFNFRNLRDRELALGAREIFLVGENGQGKTNLIEGMYLLCMGSSFRESRDASLVRRPAEEAAVFGTYRDRLSGERTVELRIAPGAKKEIRVNGKQLKERKDLLGDPPCIAFVQQDMDFVSGPPDARRRFFDQTLILSDMSFLETFRAYRQVLKSRNFVLKSHQATLLDAYDSQLAPLGLEITRRRALLVQEFNAVFSPLFREIAGFEEPVEIRYKPSLGGCFSAPEVEDHLAASRGKDLALGTTGLGPHRDGFLYTLGGRDFSHYASTGQTRLCALILRIAEARFLAERTGRPPVLLLDDVLLELDPGKRRSFISRFPPYEQSFFTFLPDENYASYRKESTLVLNVNNGDFS